MNSIENAKTIDEYIYLQSDKEVKERLKTLRQLVREEAPDAIEAIKYRMPTFILNKKNLVFFAAFKNHIGFYPVPSGIEKFKKELESYKTSKGSIQFPLDKALPLDLIRKIVKFRVEENRK
jgi:uncharacterized protein YdhG (YjbR/CyaY superfamily)